ncbi:hypothetical protein [Brevundimonas sp.]|uniref:DUF7668 domain-containing protein n=1 Tax=Brevundimonas sp. TaxID=1871086 RepID=UPI00261309DC|nr:hypothetical protein [Brevundimonas sp.]
MNNEEIALARNDEEHPIPPALRDTFRLVVEAFAAGDFTLRERPVKGVANVDPGTAKFIEQTLATCGDALMPLNEAVWERSCYRWMDGYWSMLVDLSTRRQIVSDMTLHADMQEATRIMHIRSVHIP